MYIAFIRFNFNMKLMDRDRVGLIKWDRVSESETDKMRQSESETERETEWVRERQTMRLSEWEWDRKWDWVGESETENETEWVRVRLRVRLREWDSRWECKYYWGQTTEQWQYLGIYLFIYIIFISLHSDEVSTVLKLLTVNK